MGNENTKNAFPTTEAGKDNQNRKNVYATTGAAPDRRNTSDAERTEKC